MKNEQSKTLSETLIDINAKYSAFLIDGKCSICGAKIKVHKNFINEKNTCEKCDRDIIEKQERIKRIEFNIPLGYRHMTFDNYRVDKMTKNSDVAFSIARNYLVRNEGVYLYGAPGQDKTHLMIASMQMCILSGKNCRLLNYSNELRNYKNRGWTKEDIFEKYANCKYLFIDDIGATGTKDDTVDILYGILQRRIEILKTKKVFITANIPLADIGDDRVISRIIGMCTSYGSREDGIEKEVNIVEIGGKDKRLEGAL